MRRQALDRLGAARGTGAGVAAALAAQEADAAAAAAAARAQLAARRGELRAAAATGTQLLGKLGALLAQRQAAARQAGGWPRAGARHGARARTARLAALRARVREGEARLQALCDRVAALVPARA